MLKVFPLKSRLYKRLSEGSDASESRQDTLSIDQFHPFSHHARCLRPLVCPSVYFMRMMDEAEGPKPGAASASALADLPRRWLTVRRHKERRWVCYYLSMTFLALHYALVQNEIKSVQA